MAAAPPFTVENAKVERVGVERLTIAESVVIGAAFRAWMIPRLLSFEYEAAGMANTPQAKKRIRRNARRTEVNGNRIGRIRTFVKKVEAALEAGDKAAAAAALHGVQPELMRGVAKGVLHKNTASRKFSRLNKRVAALA